MAVFFCQALEMNELPHSLSSVKISEKYPIYPEFHSIFVNLPNPPTLANVLTSTSQSHPRLINSTSFKMYLFASSSFFSSSISSIVTAGGKQLLLSPNPFSTSFTSFSSFTSSFPSLLQLSSVELFSPSISSHCLS